MKFSLQEAIDGCVMCLKEYTVSNKIFMSRKLMISAIDTCFIELRVSGCLPIL